MTELFLRKEVINYFHKNFYINARPNNSYCSCSRADHKLELSAYRKRSIAIWVCCNILQAIEATNVRLVTMAYSVWMLISMFCFDHLFSWDTFYCLVGIRNTFFRRLRGKQPHSPNLHQPLCKQKLDTAKKNQGISKMNIFRYSTKNLKLSITWTFHPLNSTTSLEVFQKGSIKRNFVKHKH